MELVGRRFGHIRVTEVVGQGGMGEVYAGYDEKLERKVALKVLNTDQRLDEEARERLLREARSLSQLEHPNICRIHDYIETGEADLLVLEYIDGRTLHEALNERFVRSDRLRIAIAIAEVLVQAHRAGIVHRDLKPENVMLTKSGEVKVLDFGLARWLNRTRARSSDKHVPARLSVRAAAAAAEEGLTPLGVTATMPSPRNLNTSTGRREFQATAIGITLGTPLYMSPEQARGESLTPASDMFSFGLLLQTLFTCQDPHPYGLTAREVILRVARGETLPVHGAPRDITALINRLKQFAPADRPTAIETLERLQFLDEKPQRIVRNAVIGAIAAIALLGGWRYTVDLETERARAVSARADAEQRRAQAGTLVRFMLGDLRQKLEPVGKLDILDDVAARSLDYLGSLRAEELTNTELVDTVGALNQLGDVRVLRGDLDAAQKTFDRSLILAKKAVARAPEDEAAQKALATTHFFLGSLYKTRGELPLAVTHLREHLRIADEMAKRPSPNASEWAIERAQGHANVGTVLEAQGQLENALQQFEISLDAKRDLLARDPNSAELQMELASSYNKVGTVRQKLGDLQRAKESFMREVATLEPLVARDPKHAIWNTRLAAARVFLSIAHEDLGDIDAALEQRRRGIETYRALVALEPDNTSWRRNLAASYSGLATLLRHHGDHAASRAAAEDAVRLITALIEDETGPKSWYRDRAAMRNAYARTLLASGLESQAIDAARASLDDLAKSGDGSATGKQFAADAHLVIAKSALASGDHARATQAAEQAIVLLGDVVPKSSAPRVLSIWAAALHAAHREPEAAATYARLRRMGFGNPDCEGCLRQ